MAMGPTLTFLGTGAGGGVPTFYCGCSACQEAQQEARFRRTRCSILVRGEQSLLVDAPPDLRAQFVREGIAQVDHFILTHEHYDHTGGLGELEYFVRIRRGSPIPTYMTSASQDWFLATHRYLEDCFAIQNVEAGSRFDLDGVTYTALDVTHVYGTIGLLMQGPHGKRTAYIPDTGPLPDRTWNALKGIDQLVLGATFWGLNWMPEDHLSIDEALQIGLALHVKSLYLTHVSMHHDTPITSQELEAYLQGFGDHIHLAYDGLCIDL